MEAEVEVVRAYPRMDRHEHVSQIFTIVKTASLSSKKEKPVGDDPMCPCCTNESCDIFLT